MINIFIDTSIFEAENYFYSKKILTLFDYAKTAKIKLVFPIIIYEELKKHITERAEGAFFAYKKMTKDRGVNLLKSFKIEQYNFLDEKLDKDVLIDTFISKLDCMFEDNNCIIVDFAPINIESVFNKYFAQEYPFNTENKKHEFPDAFALLMLENWCKKNKTTCIVLSKDEDMKNYKSEFLHLIEDYSAFIEGILLTITEQEEREVLKASQIEENLILLKDVFLKQKESLINTCEDWFKKQLNSITWDNRYIDSILIPPSEIKIEDKYYVLFVNEIQIDLEAQVHISCDISIQYDLDRVPRPAGVSIDIPINLTYEFSNSTEFRVNSINNNEDLSFRLSSF